MLHATAALLCLAPAAPQTNYGVSVTSSGTFGNGFSYFSQISADGRFVTFVSQSTNLITGDNNGRHDVFVHELATGVTTLVSVSLNGFGTANGLGLAPDISGDGRWVVWQSNAPDLVVGDTNGTWDVFLRDRQMGTTERLSLTSAGAQSTDRSDEPRITPDGRWVTFESDAALVPTDVNGQKDVYRLDRQTGALDLVSVTQAGVQGNGWSYHGDPSDDGRYVAFTSGADNLDPADTNGVVDMFWKDMVTGELRRVNVSSTGAQANGESTWPYVSGDGQTVVYSSRAGSLVNGDTNSDYDLFAYDVATATTERLNVQPNGAQANSYVRSPVSISTDGRRVIYASLSTNLVPNDTNGFQDVFLRDRMLQTTERVNLSMTGGELDDDSWVPAMTPDARVITYTSEAMNIVSGNTFGERQIFARDLTDGLGLNYCIANANSSGAPGVISASGTELVAANDLRLEASSLPSFAFGFFLTSQVQDFVASPAGSAGNLCLGGQIGRFVGPGEIQNSGAAGAFALTLDLQNLPQPLGFVPWVPGGTWNFQAWTRDSVLGQPTSNFTNGVSVTLN